MVITEGDRVAADAGLVSAHDLLLDESLLTGKSVAVSKSVTQPLSDNSIDSTLTISAGGQHSPFIFAGALVVRGTGLALVHATGARSEMGKIGGALNSIDGQQPHLQKQLQGLVRNFSIIGAIAGGIAVLLYGILRHSWLEGMLSGIALGMTHIKSTCAYATRHIHRVLRGYTALCTDKTGT